MKTKREIATIIASLFIPFVFIQSLFFKFTDAPETQYIFSVLNEWAESSFGISGLFIPPGIFNAYVIGSAELVAAILILIGLFSSYKILNALGALLALGIISGAIFFHLFTPLGVEVQGDGGGLFIMACGVFICSLYLVLSRKQLLCNLIKK